MSLMKSDRTKAPKSDRIVGYRITPGPFLLPPFAIDMMAYGQVGLA